MSAVKGLGTAEKPWQLKTPPGTSDYQAYRDGDGDPAALFVNMAARSSIHRNW